MTAAFTEPAPPTSETRAVLVNRLPTTALAQQFEHNLAIVVGINRYAYVRELKTARPDAKRLASLLRDEEGHRDSSDRYQVTDLYDEQANCEALSTLLFTTLPAQVAALGPNTRVLFYYAGHGDAEYADNVKKGFLFPQDAQPLADDESGRKLLSMAKVQEELAKLDCQHVFIILDCCSAGAMPQTQATRSAFRPPPLYWDYLQRYVGHKARQVLTSAAHNQQASDVAPGYKVGVRDLNDKAAHSPFALALFEALAADPVQGGDSRGAGRDGVVTASELCLSISDALYRQVGDAQIPGLWTLSDKGHDQGEFVFLLPGVQVQLEPAPDLTKPEHDPWPRARNRELAEALVSSSLEEEIRQLAWKVNLHPLVAVTGYAASGKTSLVRAGLLPRLAERAEDGPRRVGKPWQILPPLRLEPQAPVQALVNHIGQALGQGPADGAGEEAAALSALATTWIQSHPEERLLLAVDIAESLFDAVADAERAELWAALTKAAQKDVLHIVVTLRSDHWQALTEMKDEGITPPLATAVQHDHGSVDPFNRDALRQQVIEQPAAERMVYLELGPLVDRLLNAVEGQPAALPLLAETLHRMYLRYANAVKDHGRRNDRTLTQADYEAVGGVPGVVADLAQSLYNSLPDENHQRSMQHVLMRLVAVKDGQYIGGRASRAAFDYPDAAATARADAIIQEMAACGLVVETQDRQYVELGHSILIEAWPQIRTWLVEESAEWALQRALSPQVEGWLPDKQKAKLWDDDPKLPQVEDTLWPTGGRRDGLVGRLRWERRVLFPPKDEAPAVETWVNCTELEFVRASVIERSGFRQRLLGAVAAFVFLLMIATGISLLLQDRAVRAEADAKANESRAVKAEEIAVTNEQIAKKNEATAISAQATAVAERNIADARRLALESGVALEVNQPRSLLLAVEAQKIISETGLYVRSAEQALLDALAAPSSIALRGGPAATQIALYGRSGRWIAAGGADGNVYLWDILKADDPPALIGSHTHAIAWAGFSADDKWLVTADKESVRAWPIDPAGQISVTLYQVSEADRAKYIEITAMAISPDGLRAAAGVNDGRVWAWAVAPFSTQWSFPLNGFPDAATVLAFSADGRLLFANRGANAVIHDLENLGDELRLRPHPNRVMSGAFSPAKADKSLVTTDQFGSVFLWPGDSLFDSNTNSLKQGDIQATQLRRPAESGGMAQNPAFDPQGHWVAVSTADGTIHLWDVEKGGPLGVLIRKAFPDLAEEGKYPSHALIGHRSPVLDIVFSPDGNTLASSSIDGSVGVWNLESLIAAKHYLRVDVTDGAMKFVGIEAVQPKVLRGTVGDAGTVAIDPTGSLLLTADNAGPARLWQLRHLSALPTEVTRLNRAAPLVSCGADRWVVQNQSADGQTEVKVFQPDTVTLTDIKGFPAVDGSALCVSTPSWIAVSDKQGQIHLWAATATGWEPREPLTPGPHKNLAFSHNARWLAAAGDDGKVSVWDMADLTRQPQVLASQQQRIDSLVFSPDDRWLATGGYFPEGDKVLRNGFRLWDIASLPTGLISPTAPTRQFVSVDQLIFSSDSRYLQTRDSGCSSCRRIWDVDNPQEAEVKFEASQVFAGADGGWWATRSQDNMLYLWNVDQRTGAERTVPVALRFDDISGATALSRDGKRFAVGTRSGRVYVWDLQHPAEPFVLRGISDNQIRHVFFGEREQIIAATNDGRLARWPLDERELVALACRYAGRNLAAQEWQVAFPAPRDYQATCSDWSEAASVR